MDWGKVANSVERLILAQAGVTLPWCDEHGDQFWGARTSLRREDINTDAGLADAYTFSLLCPAGQFIGKQLPEPRTSKITVSGVEYRVLAVEQDAAGATYRIHLGEALA